MANVANIIIDERSTDSLSETYVFHPGWNPHLCNHVSELTYEQRERFEMYGLFDLMWVKKAMLAGRQLLFRAKQLTSYTFNGKHKERHYRMSDVERLNKWYDETMTANKTIMMKAFEPRLKQVHINFHGETLLSVGNPIHSTMRNSNQREATQVIGATMRNFNATVKWAYSSIFVVAPSVKDPDTNTNHFYTRCTGVDEAYKNVSVNMEFLYNQFLRETGKLAA